MKLLQKSNIFSNQRQITVITVGFIQILLIAIILIFFSRCTNTEKPAQVLPNTSGSVLDSAESARLASDSDYVLIAKFHPEEIKQKLRKLEDLNFDKGTLSYQLLDYLKKGENDLGVEFKFIDLHFDRKATTFKEKFAHEISELAGILQEFTNLKIKLMAYTDSVGEEKANEKLTEDRLKIINKRLVEAGVDQNRIVIQGLGEKYPVADNATFDGQMLNNRIIMMIINK
jgi:outer membrane protein OmpA-like peptidoglycan-associated protein